MSLLTALLLFFSCKSGNEPNLSKAQQKAEIEKDARSTDTSALVEVAARSILKRLKGQVIFESGFQENGDFEIVFHKDTSHAAPSDLIKEYYTVKRASLLVGDINNDDEPDFAIKSIWGLVMGNMFGLDWHIYVKNGDSWKRIENGFGGGKFSDMETVVSLKNSRVQTEFQELDKETMWLKDAVELRAY